MASLNPFAKSTPTASGAQFTDKIAAATSGARNQLSTVGTTAKSAFGKTTNAVTGLFYRDQSDDSEEVISQTDPLRLDNKPASIGPEVFVANGQLWESTGNFPKAMESYSKALENEPNNVPALTSIARLHFRQNNHKQAAEYFQKAIQQSPEDAGLFNDLGLTLSKLGDHNGAASALERALILAPGTSRYANNLASVKFESGDGESAYNVLAQNNKPAVAHFNMAYLHFKKGQLADARTHLSEAIKFAPQAEGDSAVKRAVDRSRDMLAQIDGTMSTVAQAAPQATVAARQLLDAIPVIQQTSQSTDPRPTAPTQPTTTAAAAASAITRPTAQAAETAPIAPAATKPIQPSQQSTPFALPPGFGMPGE